MKRVKQRILSLLLAAAMLVTLALPALAEPAPVNVQFRSLDVATRVNIEGRDQTKPAGENADYELTTNRVEGTGAVSFTHKIDRQGGVIWYIYGDGDVNDNNGVDVTGAEFLMYDLYVSDVSAIEYAGDCRVNIRTVGSAGWDNSCATVSAANLTAAYEKLHNGWNHLVLPLEQPLASNLAWAIRIHFNQSSVKAGFNIIIDDVRFVNQAYLDSQEYADVQAAKAVAIQINGLTDKSSKEEVAAVRSAVTALTPAQKAYLCNEDTLAQLEAAFAAKEAVNVQFRSMDVATRVNIEGRDQTNRVDADYELTANRLEGNGAIAFQQKNDRTTGLFWYIYGDGDVNDDKGVDISGAEYIMYDLYVNDVSKLDLGTGDSRLAVRKPGSATWDTSCTSVTAATLREAYGKLQNGWNHLVLPLVRPLGDNLAWAFRIYFASNASAKAGFTTIIDDVRFVNQAYLDSQEYADVQAAKAVAIQINDLTGESSEDEVKAARSAVEALTPQQKPYLCNENLLEAQEERFVSTDPVNISFRNFDTGGSLDMEGSGIVDTSPHYIEGTGAMQFLWELDRTGGLFWYVYHGSSTGCNIAGASHIMFDLYVSDASAMNLGTSDSRLAVRTVGSSTWDTSCTSVSAANLNAAFSQLKDGWNHVVMPLEPLNNDVAWALRIYFANGSAPAGFYVAFDDMRFVNRAYLASEEYQQLLAAKAVAITIDGLDESSDKEQLSAARSAFEALTPAQKAMVPNESRLKTLEAGNPLPPLYETKTFITPPNSDFARRHPADDDVAFTLAHLSDLHYAVNWHGQQKETYLNSINWLLNHREDEKIKMVMQLGDMTSNHTIANYNIVREGFDVLKENDMPYGAIIGNHDYGNGRSVVNYNHTFPFEEETTANPYYAGAMTDGHMENVYYVFEENGQKYMLLTLTCYPKADVIAWADKVVKDHADCRVILYTHSYLQGQNGTVRLTEETEALAEGFKGSTVFEGVVYNNPNVIAVLCAHDSYGKAGVGMLTSENAAGKTVYQFLVSDPQGYENTYGGMGFTFLMKFSKDGETVTCEYVTTRFDMDFGTTSNYMFQIGQPYDPNLANRLAAQAVEEEIEALPPADQITTADKEVIEAAKASFDSLTASQQSLVENKDKLTAALAALAAAEQKIADEAAAKAVEEAIEKLPAADKVTAEDKEAIEAAKAAFDKLTEAQQALVTNKAKLDEALEVLAALAPAIIPGDVTGDGKVNAADALEILRYAVHKTDLTAEQQAAADLNGDKAINAADALAVLRKAVGK